LDWDSDNDVALIRIRQVEALGDFTFWLSLSLNFALSTYLSQKVKWFRWAGIHFDFGL